MHKEVKLVRVGYSRNTSAGFMSVDVDQVDATVARLVADPAVVNAYYYAHPSGPATWVKGDSASHAALVQSINEVAR